MTRYRVHGSVSTRKSADASDPDHAVWLRWDDGDELKGAPKHLPVGELVASGHLSPIKKRKDTDDEK